jgi:hypothetical protein
MSLRLDLSCPHLENPRVYEYKDAIVEGCYWCGLNDAICIKAYTDCNCEEFNKCAKEKGT